MSMSELASGLASASRSADGFSDVPGYWDKLPTAAIIGRITVPALTVLIMSVSYRAGMVATILGCKGLIKIADYAEKKELSESLAITKDSLYARVTNVDSMKSEFKTAVWLTARAVVILGISKWMPQEPTSFWGNFKKSF